MSAHRAGRPTGRLAAMVRTAWARLHRGGRRVALAGLLAAGLGAMVGMLADGPMLVGGPAFASGETGGGSPAEPAGAGTGTAGGTGTGTGGGAGTSNCPSSNPPNEMTLVAGTPQTAILQSAFATGLQVALSNSNGCPVTSAAAGIPVTFSAPASGASGVFSTGGTNTAIVGADASGSVAAPPFTANTVAGSYIVTASSQYGSVSFSLTNAAPAGVWCSALDKRISVAAGEPAKLTAGVGSTQSTPVGARFPIRLAVTVTDAEGNPVPGVPVVFSAPRAGASGRFAGPPSIGRAHDLRHPRGRVADPHTADVKTSACGIAVAPAFTANDTRGGYIVKASVEHARPAAFALVNVAPEQSR